MTVLAALLTIAATLGACFLMAFLFVGLLTWLDRSGSPDPIERVMDWMCEWWERRL